MPRRFRSVLEKASASAETRQVGMVQNGLLLAVEVFYRHHLSSTWVLYGWLGASWFFRYPTETIFGEGYVPSTRLGGKGVHPDLMFPGPSEVFLQAPHPHVGAERLAEGLQGQTGVWTKELWSGQVDQQGHGLSPAEVSH
jgi:hypothetical protein